LGLAAGAAAFANLSCRCGVRFIAKAATVIAGHAQPRCDGGHDPGDWSRSAKPAVFRAVQEAV